MARERHGLNAAWYELNAAWLRSDANLSFGISMRQAADLIRIKAEVARALQTRCSFLAIIRIGPRR